MSYLLVSGFLQAMASCRDSLVTRAHHSNRSYWKWKARARTTRPPSLPPTTSTVHQECLIDDEGAEHHSKLRR